MVGDNVTEHGIPDFKCSKSFENDSRISSVNQTFTALPMNCSTYSYDVYQIPNRPHIHPGKYNRLRYSKEQWQELSTCLGEEDDIQYMYELGLLDAQSWFEQDYMQ